MKNRFLVLCIFFLMATAIARAQVITVQPAFPTANDAVVIVFDASKGSAGLKNYSGTIYAHTGVITNKSVNNSDWKYVKTSWGQNTPATQLKSIGSNLWQLIIEPDLRTYYGVPASEDILQIALVFRSGELVGNGYLEGKGDGGTDIFYQVEQNAKLSVKITAPYAQPTIVEPNTTINLSASASFANNLQLFLNGNLLDKTTNNTLAQTYAAAENYGLHWLKAVAQNDTATVTDSISFYVRPPVANEAMPAGLHQGVNYLTDTSVALVLYAPYKNHVFAIGEFNNWVASDYNYMKRHTDGFTWWTILTNLTPQQAYGYQFLIDGNLRVADPYAQMILDKWNDGAIDAAIYPDLKPYNFTKTSGLVSVLQTAQPVYNWLYPNFKPKNPQNMVAYELLTRDFTTERSFKAIEDTLNYLQNLGVTAIELMPVMEFEGNDSWGYNASYFMALDKAYGTPNAFKKLIDACHQRGIAVILDIVVNHAFGQSSLAQMWYNGDKPANNNPYFNVTPKHDFNVGNDFNHENNCTVTYFEAVLTHWLTEFKVDGFRFDLSKGLTQKNTLGNLNEWAKYDESRIKILQNYADTCWAINPSAILILEHFAENKEEKALAEYGFYLWGNMNSPYNEATMGYNNSGKSDLAWAYYGQHGWANPNLVTYMESHDEERLMYKNLQYGAISGNYSAKEIGTALARMEAAASLFMAIPGPKMIWQFGELGYDYSIEYDCKLCPKPVKWDYFAEPKRNRLYQVFAALNHLRQTEPAFSPEATVQQSVSGALKRINLNHASMDVVVIGNFDIKVGNIVPNFNQTGIWYDYFTGTTINVTDLTATITLNPGEYHIYTTKALPVPEISTGITIFPDKNKDVALGICPCTLQISNNNNRAWELQTSAYLPTKPIFAKLQIYNQLGQTVFSQNLQLQQNTSTALNNIELPANGFYTYAIFAAENNFRCSGQFFIWGAGQ
jgi:1,4-alpha-glucan branching enzyme